MTDRYCCLATKGKQIDKHPRNLLRTKEVGIDLFYPTSFLLSNFLYYIQEHDFPGRS